MFNRTPAFIIIVSALLLNACKPSSDVPSTSDSITIGAVMPLTGDLATYGKPVKEGMEFAAEEINALRGGIDGKRVKIAFEDDAGNPTQAISAFTKLIDADRVSVVLGPLTSGASLATAPIAEERKVVQLSTIAGTMALSEAGDFVFRLFPSDEFQGRYLGEVAIDTFKSGRAAIIFVNNPYGEGVRKVVKQVYTSKGGDVIAEEAVPEGGTDFNSQIAKIKALKPDLIFGLLYYNEGVQFLIQAKQQGLDTTVLGGDAWFGPIATLAGDASSILIFSSIAFGPEYQYSDSMNRFIKSFTESTGREPDSYIATGYDAVYTAKLAIERAGSASASEIVRSLYQLEFDGALGRIKFNSKGDNVGGKFSLFQITPNGITPYKQTPHTHARSNQPEVSE